MTTRKLSLLLCASLAWVVSAHAQFSPRTDYVWARDVLGATITIDGMLNEAEWAKADSFTITYGHVDGMPGSGFKVTSGTDTAHDGANAVVKVLADKVKNLLYVAVISKDSSIGGGGWENSDGILGGFYNLNQRATNLLPLQQDFFITWIDSPQVGTLPNLKGGALPGGGIITAMASVDGIANVDTNGSGQRVADHGWTIEMAVSLDSLGYQANSATAQAVMMTLAIWDADWLNSPDHIATKTWWMNEWGNNGGSNTGRILLRNDVTVNSLSLPDYPYDLIVPNAQNYPDITLDGNLNEGVWTNAAEVDIQFGNSALRNSYSNIGPNRSGQWVTELSAGLTAPVDPGMAKVKMFFKGDKLYVGADVSDQALNHYIGDDFFDGLQVNLNVPVDTLYDKTAHVMAGRRYGFAIDSVSKGGSSALWDAPDLIASGGLQYALSLKPGSTIDDPNDVDAGYTIEAVFDLTKLGYAAGEPNKTVAVGLDYHDYDLTPTDTSAYRVWWYREWPWSASSAFALLDDATLLGVTGQPAPVANEFRLYGNYPNPFNPSTTIKFSVPGAGLAKVSIFDVLGRLVRSSSFAVPAGGVMERQFNAVNLASGVYYYRVEFTPQSGRSGVLSQTMKMVLVK